MPQTILYLKLGCVWMKFVYESSLCLKQVFAYSSLYYVSHFLYEQFLVITFTMPPSSVCNKYIGVAYL